MSSYPNTTSVPKEKQKNQTLMGATSGRARCRHFVIANLIYLGDAAISMTDRNEQIFFAWIIAVLILTTGAAMLHDLSGSRWFGYAKYFGLLVSVANSWIAYRRRKPFVLYFSMIDWVRDREGFRIQIQRKDHRKGYHPHWTIQKGTSAHGFQDIMVTKLASAEGDLTIGATAPFEGKAIVSN